MGRTLLWAAVLAWANALAAQEEPAPPPVSPLEGPRRTYRCLLRRPAARLGRGRPGPDLAYRRWRRNLEKQPSGAACRLEAVQFLPDGSGWAAGGWVWPYCTESQGTVLSTRDGGQTWLPSTGTLPWIRQLRFTDPQQGWAVGRNSELAPGAIFTTSDGGRTWNPRALNMPGEWLAADFAGQGGALLGASGLGSGSTRALG